MATKLIKIMLRNLLVFSFLILISVSSSGESDTSHLRISILTCSPGEELYSTFGHSAIRVTDSVRQTDIVYNYGTFNFYEPGFYKKFVLGKLTFYLSTANFDSFLNGYQEENRGIIEQVLNIKDAEKYRLIGLLQTNMLQQNMYYKYDFTYDNCTTRLRDIIEKGASSPVQYGKVLQKPSTFRDLIYEYLNYNDHQWSKLGIDLLLGSKLDAIISNREVMFLPDYLMKTLNTTTIGKTPIVLSSQNLYAAESQPVQNNFITHPAFIFSILLLLVVFLTFSKNTAVQKAVHNFDGFVFFVVGLLGILMLFMWFGTDHIMCTNNYNLLWAWPVHSIAAFFINRRLPLIKNYFKIATIVNTLLLLSWFFLPQHLNISLMPVVLLLIFRGAMIGFR